MSKLTLLPKERIILKTNPHWLVLFTLLAMTAVGWLLSILLILELPEEAEAIAKGEGWFILSTFAFGFAGLMVFLDWWFTRFYLTNLRVIKVCGIIGKSFMAIPLAKVQDVSYRFGIIGRIFHFGDLVIESAGTYGEMVFRYIASPKEVQARIWARIQTLKLIKALKEDEQEKAKTLQKG